MPGSVIKRSATNYVVKLYQGNGKRKWITGFKSEKEARAYQATLASHPLHAANLGLYGSARDRLGPYLREWLQQQKTRVRAGTLKAKTLHTYQGFVTRYLLADLGFIPLAKLGPRVIEQQYSRLLDHGLSPTTVHHVATMLHKALRDAVKQEIIGRNPCDQVEPPARRKSPRDVWSETDTLLFLDAAKPSRYYVLYLLAATTALRPAELLGLRWQDVDFENSLLRVSQTLVRPHGGGFIFETPKTPSSRRPVGVPSEVVAELRAHKRRQAGEFLRLGPAYYNLGLVFAQRNGLPLHEHNVTQRDFRRIVKQAGLPPIRFYDLRHTHLTHLIMRGVPLPVVQERAGHASGAFTLHQYIHSLPGAQRQAVQATSAILQAIASDGVPSTAEGVSESAPHLHPNLGLLESDGAEKADG